MSNVADPRCPECDGPIGVTATYCMHCSADLTEERAAADADEDGVWDGAQSSSSGPRADGTVPGAETTRSNGASATEGRLLDPDGLVDNTLTAVVGIAGGIVVGLVGTVVLLAVTGSGWALAFGFFAWLGATAYLVRRRTVQGAIARSGYAVAVVLLLVPVIALSPFVTVDGGIEERGGLFLALLLFVAVPAGIAAATGWIASRFDPGTDSEG